MRRTERSNRDDVPKDWRVAVPHGYELGEPQDIPAEEDGHVKLPGRRQRTRLVGLSSAVMVAPTGNTPRLRLCSKPPRRDGSKSTRCGRPVSVHLRLLTSSQQEFDLSGLFGELTVSPDGKIKPIVRSNRRSTPVAASRGHLVPIGAGVERGRELDTLQRLLSHHHGLQLDLAHNDRTRVYQCLNARCVLGLEGVEIGPRAVAQRGLVAVDVDVVLDADSGACERPRPGAVVVAAGGHNDPAVHAGSRGVNCDQSRDWLVDMARLKRGGCDSLVGIVRRRLERGHEACVGVVVDPPRLPGLAVVEHVRPRGHLRVGSCKEVVGFDRPLCEFVKLIR